MTLSRKNFLRTSVFSSAGILGGMKALAQTADIQHTDRPPNRAHKNRGISISIFSKHLQWLGYTEMAKVAADLGFDGVDLTVRPGGHVLPENAERDLPRAVQAVRGEGLEVYMISTAISDPDDEYTESILKTAGALNISTYRTDWFPYDEDQPIAQNLESFRQKLSRLAEMSAQYKIQGDYQNHAGASFGSAIWDLWIVLDELDTEWIGAQYDIRHATVEGKSSWENGLKAIHPFIGTLDIKDFYWKESEGKWQAHNTPLGTGMVDFGRYFSLLKKYNVQVPVSLHYEYDLGGAEHGATTLDMDRHTFLEAIRKDLQTLNRWLSEANLQRA